MVTERLEVRLDGEHRQKLAELVERQQASISEVIRRLIDRAYEDSLRERRLELVREIAALEVEDVPDPDELSRQLDRTYDIGDLY
jgi:Arc/MetJ-type ribon-helix-helix transcriptional regulator